MNDELNKTINSLKSSTSKIIAYITKYRFTAVFIVASASVIAAVVQSGTYLNPPRNDDRYNDEKLKINYSSIDKDIVEKLSKTQQDATVEVNENLVPSRNNPFTE